MKNSVVTQATPATEDSYLQIAHWNPEGVTEDPKKERRHPTQSVGGKRPA